MDGNSFDKASKAISGWLSRRQLLKGLIAGAIGGGGRNANAQDLPIQQEPGVTPVPTQPVERIPTATEPPSTTEFPTSTPTETPWATETPTETPPPTETPTEVTEQPTPVQQQQQPVDDRRRRIAEICRAAADVLAKDVAEPSAFDNHPHPDAAYGFLDTLNGVARWGTNAETWDDAMLNNYVGSADTVAYAVRIGADAYYETLQKQGFMQGKIDESDPDTCIFRELAKWRDCMAGCDPNDAVCRLTCFWNFTVLNSCRRCLRSF